MDERIEILNSVIDGNRLSESDAILLLDLPIQILGLAAHKVRERINGTDTVSYLVDRNINYTNICDIRCSFCAFSVDRDDENAYTISREELTLKLSETVDAGGSGVLMQGGCHKEIGLDYLCELFQHIKSSFPSLRIHALSPPEIVYLSALESMGIEEVLKTLIDAGLDSLPGGGAEILVDEVRQKLSPKKCSSDKWIEVMRTAHILGLKTSATLMFGHIESLEQRIAHLNRIRELQDETSGFVAFIPWTCQPGNTKLENEITQSAGTDYLKTLAISRLFLDNVDHIGASWLTQGTKLGQVALHFGADDIGSVMLEENVVASAGCRNRTSTDELESLIMDAGFKPVRRDAIYNRVDNS